MQIARADAASRPAPATLIPLAVGGVVGALGVWLALGGRQRARSRMETREAEQLYLIFSRVSHRLKTAGEVIRGHLRVLGDDPPADAERWRVARRAVEAEAAAVDGFVRRLDLIVRAGMAGQPF